MVGMVFVQMNDQGDLFGPSLLEAREELFARAKANDPSHCKCCDHWVQIYHRKFHRTMGLDVIWLYRQHKLNPGEFVQIKHRTLWRREYGTGTGDLGKLRHWGMAEQAPNDDPHKKTSGKWRITHKGIAFAETPVFVPQYAWVYLDAVLEFDGPQVSLSDVLDHWFSYLDLMNPTDDEWPFDWG